MPESRFYFVCWRDHAPLKKAGRTVLVDQMQIHEGRWAYCALGGKVDHAWEPIEPLDLTGIKLYELRRREAEQSH